MAAMLLAVSVQVTDLVLKPFYSLSGFFIQYHSCTNTCTAAAAPIPPAGDLSPSADSSVSSISTTHPTRTAVPPPPPPLRRNKLKAQACPKINLNGGIKLKAKPREFYYVLMFELLTWIVLLKYE